MDLIFVGIFKSHLADKTKTIKILKTILRQASKHKLNSEQKLNLLNHSFAYCLLGDNFKHTLACKVLQVYLPTCSEETVRIMSLGTVELLINGTWEPHGDIAIEHTGYINIKRRIILLGMLLDSSSNLMLQLQISSLIRSEAIRLLYDSKNYQNYSEMCRILLKHESCMPDMTRGFAISTLSIHAMSDYNLTDFNDRLSYIQDINDIARILEYVWVKNPLTLIPSLREIFDILSNPDCTKEPSNALGCLIQYIPKEMVNNSVHQLVANKSISDDRMFLALMRMMSWIGWPTAIQADLWILAFFQELAEASKYTMLIDVTLKTVKQVFSCLKISMVRVSALAVLVNMLMSFKHSPEAFHIIVPYIPEMLQYLEKERTNLNDSEVLVQVIHQLCNLCHCMLYLHTGFPEIYGPILNSLKNYPRPTRQAIQATVNYNSWTFSRREAHYEVVSIPPMRSQETNKAGLTNLGNTCYMNSVLQALYMLKGFRNHVLRNGRSFPQSSITSMVEKTFSFLLSTKRMTFEPDDLVCHSRPDWFASGSQQDCSEYVKYLLDVLNEEEKLVNFNLSIYDNSPGTSSIESDSTAVCQTETVNFLKQYKAKSNNHNRRNFIEQFFHGNLQSKILCTQCGVISSRVESFVDISLPLNKAQERGGGVKGGSVVGASTKNEGHSSAQSNTTVSTNERKRGASAFVDDVEAVHPDERLPTQVEEELEMGETEPRQTHSLVKMLDEYLTDELLDGENKYSCSQCQTLTTAVKKLSITALPKHVIITLMRFTYDTFAQQRSKILDNVEIPQNIQFLVEKGDVQTKHNYKLSSIVVHSGTSANSGHYYSYVRETEPVGCDKWYLFNDSHVSKATFKDIANLTGQFSRDTAYLVIYSKDDGGNGVDVDENISNPNLMNLVQADNEKLIQEIELAKKRGNQAPKSSTSVIGWNDDDQPPPNCGGGGDFGGHNRLVF